MSRGHMIADAVAMIGTMDIVFGEIDRRQRANFSDATLARFAREVAKVPADQKQSACGLPCHRAAGTGLVSADELKAVAAYLGMPADRGARGHDLLQHVQPAAGRQVQAERLHQPAVPAANGPRRWSTSAASSASRTAETTRRRVFTVQRSECLGACADAPVMLVNDRQMLQLHERADAARRAGRHLVARAKGRKRHGRPVQFQSTGRDLLPRPPHRRADLRRPGRRATT